MSDGVCGVGGSGQRHFSDEETEALRKDESTSVIANKARRANGGKEADVTVRGDDKTLDDVIHHPHLAVGEAVGAGLHGFEVAHVIGFKPAVAAAHALGRAGVVGIPLAAWGAAQYGMYEMEKRKAELKDGATRDQLHAAVLWKLEVPAGFANKEIKHLGVSMANQDPAMKIADQITPAQRATLQMHCDQGTKGAQEMLASGQSDAAFFASHPDAKKRYDTDAAYRYGFDSLVWSKSQEDNGAAYEKQLAGLKERDGWYARACITVRS